MALDLANLQNQFLQPKNLFQDPIYQWVWRTNPFISLFDRKEFSEQDGLVPEVVTTTGELFNRSPGSRQPHGVQRQRLRRLRHRGR